MCLSKIIKWYSFVFAIPDGRMGFSEAAVYTYLGEGNIPKSSASQPFTGIHLNHGPTSI